MSERHFEGFERDGVRLRCVVEGQGPLVILLHGFPQCWYLWRHQIDPLVAAGFRVAVPDQRGYGGSDAPPKIEDYDIRQLCADVAGIADSLGEERFVVVGHDWGAPVAWHTALLYADRVRAVVGMSVPYTRGDPAVLVRQEFWGDRFWYIAYFQQPGVAEAELEANLRDTLRRTYVSISGDAKVGALTIEKDKSAGFLDGLEDIDPLPAWLSEADLDYYVAQYQQNGFRGPLNWYRNIERNYAITSELEGVKIAMPALFLTGSKDPVLGFPGDMFNAQDANFADLRGKHLIEGAGHWLQMEKPEPVNDHLLRFLAPFA